jgi:hypothetical protein
MGDRAQRAPGDDTSLRPDSDLPLVLALGPMRPNPAASGGTVHYDIPASMAGAALQAAVFDVAGRLVRTLAEGSAEPGRHALEVTSGPGLRSGVYYLRLRVGSEERRTTLILH